MMGCGCVRIHRLSRNCAKMMPMTTHAKTNCRESAKTLHGSRTAVPHGVRRAVPVAGGAHRAALTISSTEQTSRRIRFSVCWDTISASSACVRAARKRSYLGGGRGEGGATMKATVDNGDKNEELGGGKYRRAATGTEPPPPFPHIQIERRNEH